MITGYGVLSPTGVGPQPLAAALSGAGVADVAAGGLFDDPLPSPEPRALVDFDVRSRLGRKGTSSYDRSTALAVVACGEALADAGLAVDDETRHRIGVVLGTTTGSLRSTMEYSRETLVNERPYLVNPMSFPNTVMNCAAGQAAIRYRLTGLNATVAGGQLAFLNALRYSANALRRGYADVLLTGAVEELSPQSAWALRLAGHTPDVPAGEGAAVLVVRRAEDVRATAGTDRSGRVDAEVLAVATGFSPGAERGDQRAALAGCIRRVLADAGLAPTDLGAVVTGDTASDDRMESAAVDSALAGVTVPRIAVKEVLGESQAAAGALQAAAVLLRHRDDVSLDGCVTLLTGRTPDGGVGAAALRGWSRCQR